MKRIIAVAFLFALMLLSPSAGVAQEMSWSEGFDPTDPDCTQYSADCEQLIAWYIDHGDEQPPVPTPTPIALAPSGDWAFVEEYRIKMMDSAEFICHDAELQYKIRIGVTLDDIPAETWVENYPEEAPALLDSQEKLRQMIAAEREAGTPIPEGMAVPEETFSIRQTLQFLEDERGFDWCSKGGYTVN